MNMKDLQDHQRPEEAGRQGRGFVRFVMVDLEGHAIDIDPENAVDGEVFRRPEAVYGLLRQFVLNELGLALPLPERLSQRPIFHG